MTRRNLELALLGLASPVVLLLYAMWVLKSGNALSVETLGVPLGLLAAFFIAHICTRFLAPGADPALLPIAFALSGIGIVFVERLAPEAAPAQVLWLFIGVACMVLILLFFRKVDIAINYKYTLMLVGFALLLSPLLPGIGEEKYGSQIWLSIAGLSFQPGELAKIIIVLFLAGYLAQNREILSVFTLRVGPFNLPDLRALVPLVFMWLVALAIVVFEKDLGSAVVFFLLFLIMLYAATGKKFYVILGFLLIAVGGIGAYMAFDHVQVRVSTWLDPFADAQNTGYQLVQAIYSMADGGLVGLGIGNGYADQIPVVESDFIFAAIAEEMGLLGAAGVLLLFLCLAVRGLVTAARAKSDVSSFIAIGMTSMIVVQAFIIVGGVTRLIPLTGLTLPLVSQGGSSLIATFIALGFLLRCGDEATGVRTEMVSATTNFSPNSVLGRVALGKRINHTMVFCSLLFAALVANLTVTMVAMADYYQDLPSNGHTLARQYNNERGTISTSDGVILAQSVEGDDGTYTRQYPAGTLASHVVGYYSLTYGSSGIEAACSDTLAGEENFATFNDLINKMAGIGIAGNDVVLTLDSKIQQAAQDALSGKTGACVVLDPQTGAVLAMASSPTYDAADYASMLEAAANGEADESAPLLNRSLFALYAPGSTFKIVTLATALENNIATTETTFDSPGTLEIGNGTITNFGKTSYGTISLARATEVSSNTVFAQLGVEIGAETLVAGAEAFGFNKETNFVLGMYTSLMAEPSEMTEWETAWAAAGQPVNPINHYSEPGPQVTVMQMAMVASAIANDGYIKAPYLVESIYNANGKRSFTASSSTLYQAISKDTADKVYEVLRGVVTSGTGTAAAISGAVVAGKTGTAEKSSGNDSWFAGMAGADGESPSVVIALLIEDAESGTATALAKNVLKTALEVYGVL